MFEITLENIAAQAIVVSPSLDLCTKIWLKLMKSYSQGRYYREKAHCSNAKQCLDADWDRRK